MPAAGAGRSAAKTAGGRELPPAGIPMLAQSLVTQALYYLGEGAAARGGSEAANMDMAKHLIDTLGILEEKTEGRLSPDEQAVLDTGGTLGADAFHRGGGAGDCGGLKIFLRNCCD